jgi:hypothetical protein
MKKAMACRKRPCRICRRWFRPDPRLQDRQMTCGEKACKREWHRRKCARWNQENSEPIKRERLAHQLQAVAAACRPAKVADPSHPSPAALHHIAPAELLSPLAQAVIAAQLAGMIEYLLRHLVRRTQEVIRRQATVNTG